MPIVGAVGYAQTKLKAMLERDDIKKNIAAMGARRRRFAGTVRRLHRYGDEKVLRNHQARRPADGRELTLPRHCGRSEAIHFPACCAMDCVVAEPVIGPRFARTRWLLAMTTGPNKKPRGLAARGFFLFDLSVDLTRRARGPPAAAAPRCW
jgi:hypothetical protein